MSEKKLCVWWVPQIGMQHPPFMVEVDSVVEGVKMMNVLAMYDLFQYEEKIKPDYANMGGLQEWDEKEQGWLDWYDEDTGYDDPQEYLDNK